MLVYVRHGATALNKGGSEERLRGWLPVPLSELGQQQATTTARRLAQILPVQPDTFVASDLHRAHQTAQIVGSALGQTPEPDPRVRDWNTGKLAGQKVDDVLPLIKELIKNPDDPAPGGEALNQYLDRFVPTMREKVASPGVHLVVGHARGATILEGIADDVGGKGGDINPRFLLERPRVQPGGVLIIDKNWNTKVDNPEQEA
jgi:broad specificity phosphatase PhoE